MKMLLRKLLPCALTLMAGVLVCTPASGEEEGRKGLTGPFGARTYWEHDGLHHDGARERLRFRLNGHAAFDWGSIFADRELEEAFPGREGSHSDFRTLQLSLYGWIGKGLEFKVSIDFSNVRQVKDNWVRFPTVPVLRQFKIGNVKEPFSLEELTSSRFRTFMESSMATYALSPGRDIGLLADNLTRDGRVYWAAGLFLNTGSLSSVGDTKEKISEAAGWNLTGRLTGLPWYEEKGRRLLHLGLGYSYQFRDDETVTAKSYPESRLTGDKLVDTGEFISDGSNLVGLEAALVHGPLSLQGELMARVVDGSGNPLLWGFYGYGSWFLTGEHRRYDTFKAVFTAVTPDRRPPWRRGWGAWELAVRYSYLDLNDGALAGGVEQNFTAGLNWYLTRRSRFMFNYINADVTDRANPPAVDDGSEQTYAARFEFWF